MIKNSYNETNKRALRNAIAELNFISCIIDELNHNKVRLDIETAKHFFSGRGYSCEDDGDDFGDKNSIQFDIFGTFVDFTLTYNKINQKLGVNYGWSLDDHQTDLYKMDVGDFRPYYDDDSKKQFMEVYGEDETSLLR